MDTRLAFDRSMRRKDVDGHLHVEMTNVSKANVCPYLGREIPDSEAIGLDPNAIYMLYRDPAELQAAAQSIEGKPVLFTHKPVTAEQHPEELVVGSVGTGAEYKHPFLQAPMSVWRQDAIDAVEADPEDDEYQGELSPGYRYRADMSPGHTPEGVAFHGRMRDIKFNHLAIVKEGRTGHDVIVADELPLGLQDMRFKTFFIALAAAIPTLKAEQVVALDAALDAEMPKAPAIDAFPDMSAEDKKVALDKFCSKTGKAMDKLTDEDKAEAYKTAKDMRAATGNPATGHAADAALVKTAVDSAVAEALKGTLTKADADKLTLDAATAARAQIHALYTARKDVESTVGVVAMDSAEAVYRFALDHLKVDHKEIPSAALAALYTASAKTAAAPALAADAAFDVSSIWTHKA